MALVARVQSKLEWPKTCSQGLPSVYAVKIVDGGLHFLFFIFTLFFFYFYFSIFRTTQVRIYQSCCYISHKLMV